MNIFKKMYRDFFGLTEQTSFGKKPDPTKDVVLSADDTKDPKKVLEGWHPNALGHDIWTNEMYKYITENQLI